MRNPKSQDAVTEENRNGGNNRGKRNLCLIDVPVRHTTTASVDDDRMQRVGESTLTHNQPHYTRSAHYATVDDDRTSDACMYSGVHASMYILGRSRRHTLRSTPSVQYLSCISASPVSLKNLATS
jgi:hypothetical protein